MKWATFTTPNGIPIHVSNVDAVRPNEGNLYDKRAKSVLIIGGAPHAVQEDVDEVMKRLEAAGGA